MDIEHSFKFIFEDEDWIKKILIAAVLMITGIGAFAVTGYLAEVARRSANNEEQLLPQWEDIGQFFILGLKYMAIAFIWSLPAILLIFTLSLLSVFAFTQDDPGAIAGVVTVFSLCIYTMVFIYILLLTMLMMPLWVQLADNTPFGDLINPGSTWKLLRANLAGYIVIMLITWLAAMAASLVGTLLCGVGVFFTSVIAQVFFAHLVGQATAQARETLNHSPAVPVK